MFTTAVFFLAISSNVRVQLSQGGVRSAIELDATSMHHVELVRAATDFCSAANLGAECAARVAERATLIALCGGEDQVAKCGAARGAPPFDLCIHAKGDYISDVLRRSGSWDDRVGAVIDVRLAMRVARSATTRSSGHSARTRHSPQSLLFIDVGANIGYFSLYVAASMGVDVVAFEPVASNARLLHTSALLLAAASGKSAGVTAGSVTVLPFAIGDVALMATAMTVNVANNGGAAVAALAAQSAAFAPERQQRDGWLARVVPASGVATVPLCAALSATQQRRVALIKVDVEGYEGAVVSGAQCLWRRRREAVDHIPPRRHRPDLLLEVTPLAQSGATEWIAAGGGVDRNGVDTYASSRSYAAMLRSLGRSGYIFIDIHSLRRVMTLSRDEWDDVHAADTATARFLDAVAASAAEQTDVLCIADDEAFTIEAFARSVLASTSR